MARTIPIVPAGPAEGPPQHVAKVRRDYNSWVARETIEDYALRFTPRSFRRWSIWRVANSAAGGAASFLILEAIGATLLVQHGFVNAALAIVATGLVIFLAGLPISVYAARHGVDMDLLTRGAGFGYIGSTVTSLIYASFTFIFFALEAAVMAYALELAFGIPPAWGYLVCALVVIPLVIHGVTALSRLQAWTLPIWLVMLVAPYVAVFAQHPDLLADLARYGGEGAGGPAAFDWIAFGAATTVGIALITQMGEQVDYLRFMPERTAANRWRWWAGVLVGGPGWVVPGVLKMLGGALLAYLAITHMVPPDRAVDPNQMYLVAYEFVFSHYGLAVAATAVFVIVSQLKINVTNAYAGSLAWSNFFSRLTHSHPGRVVWMVFNTAIALVLMELNVFQALGHVLGLYANIAIAWIMAVVADLVVNKPLGLSPPGIEFRRAHLYDVNPVGVGAMGLASLLSITAHLGWYGEAAQAYSAAIALVTAFVASPLLAWATRGRYYIARPPVTTHGADGPAADATAPGRYARLQPPGRTQRCVICERDYETDDMAHCPAYQGTICSLCCTLDARCDDLCKPDAHLSAQWAALLRRLLPRRVWPTLDAGLGHWLLLMTIVAPALALLLGLLYHEGARSLADEVAASEAAAALLPLLRSSFVHVYLLLLVIAAVACWWLVLAHQSRRVAQEESNRQTQALRAEIASHRRTDEALQQAKAQAEAAQRAAEAANQAKSRYITTISHELRTPLNSILGYAQLLEADEAMPPARRHAVQVIRRGGDHLLSLIEGTLDIARIESGKLALDLRPMPLRDSLREIAHLFELQAAGKGIGFACEIDDAPAVVRADEKRLRQILINLLGNAVKFTQRGGVRFRLHYTHDLARFEIEDTGPGMSADELDRVFEPFVRGASAGGGAGGTGLGLTIAKMLAELMGGELTASSRPGAGTTFRVRLFLPELPAAAAVARASLARTGYAGPRRRVLVVDNEDADRGLVASVLQPLGFDVAQAASGEQCLELVRGECPDAILMDLAMPGIDGWETIRRLRAAGFGDIALAVVSANAFDRGLDHDVALAAQDFIVKPVRLPELLDWLGRRLDLQWLTSPPVTAAAAAAAVVPPEPPQLRALQQVVRSGYVRGILRRLDAIEAAAPASAGYVAELRQMARDFQLEALSRRLERDLTTVAPR
jgi:signal transduction histidine kinase/purine-cytosine permease-like protein/FixJ family two-component response regulator